MPATALKVLTLIFATVSALITLSGALPPGFIQNALAALHDIKVVEITEKVIDGVTSLVIVLSGSTQEIQSRSQYSILQELARVSGLNISCEHIESQQKLKPTTSERGGSRRLVLLDVDSTLIQEEVIELLANKAGAGAEVARITAAAMSGEIDFASALHARVQLLAGLPEQILEEVRSEITLTKGARELILTLKRLNHYVGVVSGGFIDVIEPLAKELQIDYLKANKLEIKDRKLTGGLEGDIVDRAGKAVALRDFAKIKGVDIADTVAIGDGANDIDMLKVAGIGIAFNAKPILQSVADISLNTPNLDHALYLIGLSKSELATF